MRKNVYGRQLKRDANERKALFKSLMTSLVIYERIKTTRPKAKAIQSQVEKLVTLVKRKRTDIQSFLLQYVSSAAAEKLIVDIAPRFDKRQGGYTRIIQLEPRFLDNAPMALIEWVEKTVSLPEPASTKSEVKKTRKQKAAVKKTSARTRRKE